MAFVPSTLLTAAIDGLKGKHPLAVLVLPAMLHSGVTVVETADDGCRYGSSNELDMLNKYFRLPGHPLGKPYRAVWERNPAEYWRDDRYAGRSLQRIRTDRVKEGTGFFQKKLGTPGDLWGLRPNCGPELSSYVGEKVRIADLAIWYGRAWDVADVNALIAKFSADFSFDKDALIGSVYSEDVPQRYKDIPFSPDLITAFELAEATDAAPPPPVVEQSLSTFVRVIGDCAEKKGMHLAAGFVERVVGAWVRGDIVVLVGQPGTGKTRFAQVMSECLRSALALGGLKTTWVAIRPDFDEAELVGYERLDGQTELRDFALQVLKSDEPLGPHLVVLEEFNLAPIENYLASILIAAQDPERRVRLPGKEQASLPVDTFILATCNSYLDEPESRTRLSFPTKRRCAVITMPNVLYERYESQGAQAILDLALDLINRERSQIEGRRTTGLSVSFDLVRLKALQTVTVAADLSNEVRDKLLALGKLLLDSPEGRDFFTLGLLKDVALGIAYAERHRDAELAALGRQVADKVIHQLRGTKERADALRTLTADLPNQAEIDQLLDRMKAGPSNDLLPLV
ncbi:MAG: AAA family ATPase [Dehalococcoidia bacterium]